MGLFTTDCDDANSIDSRLLSFNNQARMDTTLAFVSFFIQEEFILDKDQTVHQETTFGANVFLKPLNSTIPPTGFGNISDIEGKGGFYAKPGSYDLKVSFIGHNPLIVKDLILTSGMSVRLEVMLGFGCGQNTYQITETGEIKEVIVAEN